MHENAALTGMTAQWQRRKQSCQLISAYRLVASKSRVLAMWPWNDALSTPVTSVRGAADAPVDGGPRLQRAPPVVQVRQSRRIAQPVPPRDPRCCHCQPVRSEILCACRGGLEVTRRALLDSRYGSCPA